MVIYYSYEKLKETIEKYINYYNEKRIREKLKWMSPVKTDSNFWLHKVIAYQLKWIWYNKLDTKKKEKGGQFYYEKKI